MVVASLNKHMKILCAKLQEEYNVYEQMAAVYAKERAMILAGDMIGVKRTLIEKNALLDSVARLNDDMIAFKAEWARSKDFVEPELRMTIVEIVDNFKKLMEQIVALQKENETLLFEQNVKRETSLCMVRTGKSLSKAYSVYSEAVPQTRFMDKHS